MLREVRGRQFCLGMPAKHAIPVSLTTLLFPLTDFSLLCCFIELLPVSAGGLWCSLVKWTSPGLTYPDLDITCLAKPTSSQRSSVTTSFLFVFVFSFSLASLPLSIPLSLSRPPSQLPRFLYLD